MNEVRITAVSYVNTKPFLYGLLHSPLAKEFSLSLDVPSVCAAKLRDGQADIGLIPVAALTELDEAYLLSDFCIGSNGPVRTVCLFSQVGLDEIDRVVLDFHSRTSVALVKLLFRKYWKKDVEFIQGERGFEKTIGGRTAGLVIGDKVIELEDQYAFRWDLSAVWKDFTGLPFVFAVWVSRKEMNEAFKQAFNKALEAGINAIPRLVYILPEMHQFDLKEYFTRYIDYSFDRAKKDALDQFFKEAGMTFPFSVLSTLTQPAL